MATNQRLHAALERGKEKSTWYSCVSQINDGIRMGDEKGPETQKEVGGIGKGLHLRSERYWGKRPSPHLDLCQSPPFALSLRLSVFVNFHVSFFVYSVFAWVGQLYSFIVRNTVIPTVMCGCKILSPLLVHSFIH